MNNFKNDLIALHEASFELVKDFSLDHLLERIAEAACEQADARYAALGVLDENGKLVKFITVGMTDDEIKLIASSTCGEGINRRIDEYRSTLACARDFRIIRVPSGFPGQSSTNGFISGCPHSGSSTINWDRSISLRRLDAPEFTADDEKIIQMLAAYAAAAIQNARLHENTHRLAVLEERERIGMDLHDGIIQSIYGVGLSLEGALHSFEEDPDGCKDAHPPFHRRFKSSNP